MFWWKKSKVHCQNQVKGIGGLGCSDGVVESKLTFKMALKKKDWLELDAEVRAANEEVMHCLGGFPLKLSIPDGRGNFKESKQFTYVVTKLPPKCKKIVYGSKPKT